jgi:hypothetical protein
MHRAGQAPAYGLKNNRHDKRTQTTTVIWAFERKISLPRNDYFNSRSFFGNATA